MGQHADMAPRPLDVAGVDPMAGIGRIIASIAVAAGLCLILGLVLGAAWAEAIRSVSQREYDTGMCWMCHGMGGTYISLWLGSLLITVVPAAIIGYSRSALRRVGLAGLIGAVTTAALVGFALSTGIGGRFGFPGELIPGGVIAGLVSVSVGAAFGYEVGSVIRRHRAGSRLTTGERSILFVLGAVVLVVFVFVLLALIDAIVFG